VLGSLMVCARSLLAAAIPTPGQLDARVRTAVYDADQVYRLEGYAGFAIDLEFAADEVCTGIGGGDIEGIITGASGNHLTLKPKAVPVQTNFSVYTNRRVYHIDYRAVREPITDRLVIFAVRFTYPAVKTAESKAAQVKAAVA